MRMPIVALPIAAGCARAECTPPDYSRAECRVQAENQLARGTTADGIEIRFQDPNTTEVDSWEGLGRVSLGSDGRAIARVAALGAFRISVHRGEIQPSTPLLLDVTNVHPAVAPLLGEVGREGLIRHIALPLTERVTEIEGILPLSVCDGGYTIAAVGDIQTGPLTFQSILDDLHAEAAYAESRGQPLLGMLLLGDLAEFGSQEEFDAVQQMFAASPVPIAVTPGNHDIYATVLPFFNATFGPGNYAFDVCDTHIAMLDTGNAEIAASIEARLPELLDTDQRFSLVGTHMPPYAALTSDGWRREDQAQHLLVEMAARDADLLLAGHIHWRGSFLAAPVPEIIVGTAGASQRKIDPDYGYLRAVFTDTLETCFLPVPVPGSPGAKGSRAPQDCPPR